MPAFTDKQQEIINSAIELISEVGIQQLTIKNLARKTRKTEGAIYRHFESKFDILRGILLLFRQDTVDTFQNRLDPSLSPLQKLENMLITRIRRFVARPAIAAVLFAEEIFQNEKSLATEVWEIMQVSQGYLEKVIEQGQSVDQIRNDIPATQLALLIAGALRLLVTQWRLSHYAFNLEEEGVKLWGSISRVIRT